MGAPVFFTPLYFALSVLSRWKNEAEVDICQFLYSILDNYEEQLSSSIGVKILIFDREYRLKAKEGEEYLKAIAAYVDGKIKKIASSTNERGREQISILACLNIADELYKLKEKNRKAKEKIRQLMERVEKEAQ